MPRAVITGIGAYLPARAVSNRDLEKMVETSDEWIATRTGIQNRHIAADGEYTSDLAANAAREAMAHAGVQPADVDLIIVATTTPDKTIPATAAYVQHKLGVTRGPAFDVAAACAGFVYALTLADALIRTGQAMCALVIGAETFTRVLDWEDRTTCVLFGDGAGAAVVQKQEGEPSADTRGIFYSRLFADGSQAGILATDGGASSTGTVGKLRMSGKEVFRHAVAKMSDCVTEGLDHCSLALSDVDWMVPHQANQRIMEAISERLHFPAEKIVATIARHANTSAASIPLALAQAVSEGKIRQNNLVVLNALGAGLTWGTCFIRW